MIWVITGPTGSGKTDLALSLARKAKRMVINADPYQFYREIPILSNQPEKKDDLIEGVATRSIFEPLSAGVFSRMVTELPHFQSSVFVGTGLYVGAALYGLDEERVKGTPFQGPPRFNYRAVVLDLPRQELYERLNQRVDLMIQNGAIEESEKVYRQMKSMAEVPPSAALKAIGLKTLLMYHANEITLERAIELWKRDTRRLAKRQWNWLRKFVPQNERHLWTSRSNERKIEEFLECQS